MARRYPQIGLGLRLIKVIDWGKWSKMKEAAEKIMADYNYKEKTLPYGEALNGEFTQFTRKVESLTETIDIETVSTDGLKIGAVLSAIGIYYFVKDKKWLRVPWKIEIFPQPVWDANGCKHVMAVVDKLEEIFCADGFFKVVYKCDPENDGFSIESG